MATPFARGATLHSRPKPATLDLSGLSLEEASGGLLLRANPETLLLLAQAGLIGMVSLLQTRGLAAAERTQLESSAAPLVAQLDAILQRLDPGFGSLDAPCSPSAATTIACLKVLELQLGRAGL